MYGEMKIFGKLTKEIKFGENIKKNDLQEYIIDLSQKVFVFVFK